MQALRTASRTLAPRVLAPQRTMVTRTAPTMERWQDKDLFSMSMAEQGREDVWPFMVSLVYVYFVLSDRREADDPPHPCASQLLCFNSAGFFVFGVATAGFSGA